MKGVAWTFPPMLVLAMFFQSYNSINQAKREAKAIFIVDFGIFREIELAYIGHFRYELGKVVQTQDSFPLAFPLCKIPLGWLNEKLSFLTKVTSILRSNLSVLVA